MKSLVKIASLSALSLVIAACAAPIKGTVYKQEGGTYKATYSAKTEREALKTVHKDAEGTCRNKAKTKEFIVVDEKVETMTEKAEGAKEGFASVASSAIRATDKFFGNENVRASLIFKCDKS